MLGPIVFHTWKLMHPHCKVYPHEELHLTLRRVNPVIWRARWILSGIQIALLCKHLEEISSFPSSICAVQVSTYHHRRPHPQIWTSLPPLLSCQVVGELPLLPTLHVCSLWQELYLYRRICALLRDDSDSYDNKFVHEALFVLATNRVKKVAAD